jgi:nitrate/nitrite-specific signal transduction histidine kinase
VVYSLAEILRNFLEHSQAQELWYAAQYWQSRNWVELATLDEGIGIRRSLARKPPLPGLATRATVPFGWSYHPGSPS